MVYRVCLQRKIEKLYLSEIIFDFFSHKPTLMMYAERQATYEVVYNDVKNLK